MVMKKKLSVIKKIKKQKANIRKQNHLPTEQLWTIQNPNLFGFQAPTLHKVE